MQRTLIPLLIASALCAAALTAAKPSPPRAVVTTFHGVAGLTEDGLGAYVHGTDCVNSFYSLPSGDYTFRTAGHTLGTCEADQQWPRSVSLDLSNQVTESDLADCPNTVPPGLSIDICGPNTGQNTVRDARLGVAGLFGSATSAAVSVYLSQRPDLNDTEFVLTYQQPLTIAPLGAGRTLSSAGPNHLADLYQAVKKTNRKGVVVGYTLEWLGTWNVPVNLTVTPVQQ